MRKSIYSRHGSSRVAMKTVMYSIMPPTLMFTIMGFCMATHFLAMPHSHYATSGTPRTSTKSSLMNILLPVSTRS